MFKVIIILLVVVGVYHTFKGLPENISYESETYKIKDSSVHFLKDETFLNTDKKRESKQEIFDEVFHMIDEAKRYILVDFFLYNDFMGTTKEDPYRALSFELTQKLVDKKRANPEIVIQLITDPINTVYGGYPAKNFERLRAVGVDVIVTDLTKLRDSNPVYSSLWRTFFQWFGNSNSGGYLPNPFDVEASKLNFRTYLAILNYKANHRKVVLTDYDRDGNLGLATLVTSANPHDGSSAHSNTALRIDDYLWKDVLVSEATVAKFSGYEFVYPDSEFVSKIEEPVLGALETQLLTEGKIKTKVIDTLSKLKNSDRLDMAMFYLSDRDVVNELKQADKRGVNIRLLLDPNKDAFGREKNGIPNRQVANELISDSSGNTKVRWCNTSGEQCHSKLILAKSEKEMTLIQGSANLTRRNIDDFNLETNVSVTGPSTKQVFVEAQDFFSRLWNNEDERSYSVAYEVYQDDSIYRTTLYRFKEFTGLSRW